MDQKPQEVIRVAQTLFHQNPDWVTFFREVLGLGGIVRQMYPSAAALTESPKCLRISSRLSGGMSTPTRSPNSSIRSGEGTMSAS